METVKKKKKYILHDIFRPAPEVKPLDLKVESSTANMSSSEVDDQVYRLTVEVRTILSMRKSPKKRDSTYEFYKKIYSSIEQEMLSEQDCHSTACRDPYVEKLLEKLIVKTGWGALFTIFSIKFSFF